ARRPAGKRSRASPARSPPQARRAPSRARSTFESGPGAGLILGSAFIGRAGPSGRPKGGVVSGRAEPGPAGLGEACDEDDRAGRPLLEALVEAARGGGLGPALLGGAVVVAEPAREVAEGEDEAVGQEPVVQRGDPRRAVRPPPGVGRRPEGAERLGDPPR